MPRPNSAAIDCLVMSSDVGPSPPVVITAPVRSSASPTARGDLLGVVADRRASHDVHADRRERAREVRGVRVDREAEEQLVADGDELERLRRRVDRRRVTCRCDVDVAKTPLKLRR